jgi:acyl-CoA thioesterase
MLTPQDRAARAASEMWNGDKASQWLGMTLDEIAPGIAVTSMVVQEHHLNGHKICHGGFIFTLADSAFAFACNSYNQLAVAQHNTVSFIAPGRLGERLVARAVETNKTGRNGIYDVTVTGENDRVIAEFRGCSRVISGTHFDENEDQT